ncbi:MAG: hypothetical protein NPIRA02_26170 [Nitrospirales bacterium]|nr:MAG: hypothetical protein NPIRA02_26170 [Nitrospirales bacterium]
MAVPLRKVTLSLLLGLVISCAPSSAFIHPKVPEEKLTEARAVTNPFPKSYWVIDDGKALYEGKGMCVRCHGRDGDGRGSAASHFETLPRNFKNRHFWTNRSEGELFWIIKNGSETTGMLEFQSLLTDEEIWKILRYTETFPNGPYPSEPVKPLPPQETTFPSEFYLY